VLKRIAKPFLGGDAAIAAWQIAFPTAAKMPGPSLLTDTTSRLGDVYTSPFKQSNSFFLPKLVGVVQPAPDPPRVPPPGQPKPPEPYPREPRPPSQPVALQSIGLFPPVAQAGSTLTSNATLRRGWFSPKKVCIGINPKLKNNPELKKLCTPDNPPGERRRYPCQ
jgi:hypothetical protein